MHGSILLFLPFGEHIVCICMYVCMYVPFRKEKKLSYKYMECSIIGWPFIIADVASFTSVLLCLT